MTPMVTITSELDHLDQLGARAFAGFLVRKDLVRNYYRQYPVSTYVAKVLPMPVSARRGLHDATGHKPVGQQRSQRSSGLLGVRMENRGLEPLTSAVRSQRSTS